MKIKILHILHSLQIGGMENGVVNLINYLNGNIFEHVVCCIASSGPMAERLKRPVKIYSLHKVNSRDYFLSFKIAKVIKEVKPHIVHTRNWSAIDGVIGAMLGGIKCIIHGEHGREASDPEGANRRRKNIRKLLNPWISMFVAVSGELKEWLLTDVGIPEKKVIQIINGVDVERFAFSQNKKLSKEKTGFSHESFIIGTIGRLDPVKDFQTLIKAFACLPSQDNKMLLLIVGSGPEELKLKTLAKELRVLDRIFFLGERKDIPELLRSMDVFVLPSIAEGVSNTILEAMASGLPVIATKVGGNLELIKNGKTGFLFNPGDYRVLAEKMLLYYSNLNLVAEHGVNGRARTENEFSLSVMLRKYEKIYTSLLPGTFRI